MVKQLDTVVKVSCTSKQPLLFTIYRTLPNLPTEELLTAERSVVHNWLLQRDLRPIVGTSFWVGSGNVLNPAEELCHLAPENVYGKIDNTLAKEFQNA